ncbi:MAG: UDP-N-acetylmuramate dehydrogenase [Phycisphaerales bacterium]|jgi:UDP-N-acetylmuramate dehydrogenase|nr:UDP-N-acetylmuramate dehydrogenase [Phycisphaerales bacterium]MDP6889935.1 UDP-N-acetylmuramate dehydrogenase [Phycisphaerales bacterium]
MNPSRSSLLGDLDIDVTLDAPIGAMTWYGIGGRADVLASPRTTESLVELVKRCRGNDTPVRVLGGGANLLVDDGGVEGVVIKLDHEHFRRVRYTATGDITAAATGAGTDLFRLVQDTRRRGLHGFEMMAGIPGTAGGAVRMNAGGAWGQMSDCLRTVTLLSLNGVVQTLNAADLGFRYRGSDLSSGIITECTLELREEDPIRVRDRVMEIFQHKRSTQPMADHSAGCAFRNPADPETGRHLSAGAIIDEVGLKGKRIGGAVVSEQHANFIVTEPGASATDVRRLIDEIRTTVLERMNVNLEPEVVIWKRSDVA